MSHPTIIWILPALILVTASATPAQEQETPSAALQQINKKIVEMRNAGELKSTEDYLSARKSLAEEALAAIELAGLQDPQERLNYGDLLMWAEKVDEGEKLFIELSDAEGDVARSAMGKHLNILLQQERLEDLEARAAEYRQRFAPVPDDPRYLFMPTYYLVSHYQNTGNLEAALKVLNSELDALNAEAPYSSYQMVGYAMAVYLELGREAEYRELLDATLETLRQAKAAHEGQPPSDESAKTGHANVTKQYERLLKGLENSARQLELIGKPAPGFEFTHFYNSEPLSLDALKGKVVMIDFWANWCGPCKRAFPSMKQLYADLRDEGFVILGVTSLQGRFSDGEIREQELEPERELELTEDFIERYGLTWPIAFSSETVFDPDYGVTGIPTFAILDKDGVVRMIQVGSGHDEAVRRIVGNLLAQ
ncbi:MAG TPA: TlpA disulfide reductase family protein [Acidobacteriota bacterium]|nr:TlpA disulfide reductase family protein [Acidobacteriota bacterium]